MDEVSTLKKQIRRLQRRLDNIEKPDNQAAVDELVASGEENHERQAGRTTGSGFSKLMGEVRQRDHETVLRQAVTYVRNNAARPINSLKESIVQIYGIGGADLDAVIAEGRRK